MPPAQLALGAAAAALLLLLLERRRESCLGRLGAPALRHALAQARTPAAAALALAAHAARALGLPATHVSLLVFDSGLATRGYLVRGSAPLPATPAAMEVLPAWALVEGDVALPLRSGSGERMARVCVPLGGTGSSSSSSSSSSDSAQAPLGALVALVPCACAAQHALLLRELVACAEAAGLGAALAGAPAPLQPPAGLPLQALQALQAPVEASWDWDVFGGLPLAGGHWPDMAAEERRQYERAMGLAPSAAAWEAGCGGVGGAVRQGEARLQAAVVEMLCGQRTQALLGPSLRLPAPALHALALRVRQHYRGNAFHNHYHAVGVLHCAWLLAGVPGVAQRLQPLGTLALLLSALGHDLGHPGHNNGLELALGTPWALLHNDASILERHHASALWGLLEGCAGLLEALSQAQRSALRALLLGAVLHTDIAGHGALMAELEGLSSTPPAPHQQQQQQQQQQATLVAALLHAADLGGQAYRGVHTQLNWAGRIRAEFRSQAALEGALGLPPTPHMQGLHCERAFAASQVGFLNGVALPLWQRLQEVLGGLHEPLANLVAASELYARMAAS